MDSIYKNSGYKVYAAPDFKFSNNSVSYDPADKYKTDNLSNGETSTLPSNIGGRKPKFNVNAKRHSTNTLDGLQWSDEKKYPQFGNHRHDSFGRGWKANSCNGHDLSRIKENGRHYVHTPQGKICRSIIEDQSDSLSFEDNSDIHYTDYVKGELAAYCLSDLAQLHDVLTREGQALGKIPGVSQEKGNLIIGDFAISSETGSGEQVITRTPLKLIGKNAGIPEPQEKSIEETRLIIGRQAYRLYGYRPELEQQITRLNEALIKLIKDSLDKIKVKTPMILPATQLRTGFKALSSTRRRNRGC